MKNRLFIAVDIPEGIKKYLYEIGDSLSREDKDIKKVPYHNIHITLKFLGNVNLNKIEKVKHAVKKTAENFNSFNYMIARKLSAFSSFKNARIVFVDITVGGNKLIEICSSLEDNLSKIKIRREKRKFIPHITIARIREKKNIEKLFRDLKLDSTGLVRCCKLTLFESKLKPGGAEYIIIEEFSLK